MELGWLWVIVVALFAGYNFVYNFLRKMNGWYYDMRLRKKQWPLPPGDMGWPLIGNLLAFMRDFSSGEPDSFINNLVSKYGRTGIYKTHLFGNPSIIVCTPETCRLVLKDDEHFQLGLPKSISKLVLSKPWSKVSNAEHKRFRRLTTAPIIGHGALGMYLERTEDIVINSLEEMASTKHPVELLKELKKVSFKVILHIFIGSDNNHSIVANIRDLFADVHDASFSLPIDLPGFSFHKALKARKKLVGIIQAIVDERRMMMMKGCQQKPKKDLMDILLEVEDESGRKLEDEDISDLLLGFLFAGHESTASAMMWSIIYLTEHPEIMKKAKEEQEEIVKARPPSQTQINIMEIKQMVYLAKVIDETLRLANLAFAQFREATADVNVNGYIVPKGWRVLIWARAVHMNHEYYPNPEEFNPSRWEDYNAKARRFLPFGAGSRLCPGIDLAKFEISIFLHYFLLSYKLERVNSKCHISYLPTGKPKDNCLGKVIKVPR